jgi:hypothetical protein
VNDKADVRCRLLEKPRELRQPFKRQRLTTSRRMQDTVEIEEQRAKGTLERARDFIVHAVEIVRHFELALGNAK